jgi:hypothetical protein|tara:strand:+ start:159 stop:317 length:159 start_codon:yes stop_codon:yes gene_type:complete
MNFSDRELYLLQAAINGECIKLLKKKKLQYIKVAEEYETIEEKLGINIKKTG